MWTSVKNLRFWLTVAIVVGSITLIRINQGQAQLASANVATLQSSIDIQPAEAREESSKKIQPGTSVKLRLLIENRGPQTSPTGEVYIQYAFIKPLDNHPRSVIFQTEKQFVPALKPGQKIAIDFQNAQSLPSLPDFIREDWPMREYQAIFIVDEDQTVLSTRALTFSAYYYPGLQHEIPVEIPVREEAIP